METSGLSTWFVQHLRGLDGVPPLLILAIVCALVTFLTELVSNTACVQIVLPILAPLAAAIHVNPLLLMIPATVAASCGFALPVGTPPNAIVFGTGQLKVTDMIRAGILIDVISVVLVTVMMYFYGVRVFHIGLDQAPSWTAP